MHGKIVIVKLLVAGRHGPATPCSKPKPNFLYLLEFFLSQHFHQTPIQNMLWKSSTKACPCPYRYVTFLNLQHP